MYISNNRSFIDSLEEQKKLFLGWQLFINNRIKREPEYEKRIFTLGSMKILDYGGKDSSDIILVIPSLINRYYILDLSEQYSLIKYLLSIEYRVFVIEWDNPELLEYQFNLENYLLERIIPSIDFISVRYKRKIVLLGYCLGGTLSIMVSLIAKEKIQAMILIATPWKFNEIPYLKGSLVSYQHPLIFPSQIKNLFYCIDYERIVKKFSEFLNLQKNSEKYFTFLKIESWLENGIAVTTKVMNDIINLSKNKQVKFQSYNIGDSLEIDSNNSIPKLIIIPLRDKIVPIEASVPITKARNTTRIILYSGHIGILVNDYIKKELYESIKLWKKNQT